MSKAGSVIHHNGRKEIVVFLRPYLDLPDDPHYAWQKITRWRKRYYLPIEHKPNGIPFLDESLFMIYWKNFLEKRRQKALKKVNTL